MHSKLFLKQDDEDLQLVLRSHRLVFAVWYFYDMKADNVFAHAFDRINGHPGGYVRIAGRWRLEEVRNKRGISFQILSICFERSTSVVFLYLNTPKVSYLDPVAFYRSKV